MLKFDWNRISHNLLTQNIRSIDRCHSVSLKSINRHTKYKFQLNQNIYKSESFESRDNRLLSSVGYNILKVWLMKLFASNETWQIAHMILYITEYLKYLCMCLYVHTLRLKFQRHHYQESDRVWSIDYFVIGLLIELLTFSINQQHPHYPYWFPKRWQRDESELL